MKTAIATWLLVTLSLARPLAADEEMAPYAHVVAAEGGRYYLKLVPKKGTRDDGSATVYSVRAGTVDRLHYQTSGWFAFEAFLSYNGEHIVRLGNWPRGHKPSTKDLAIAFYTRGRLVKRYSTADLIKNPAKIGHSVSHYQYKRKTLGFVRPYSTKFALISADGIRYTFDVTTGQIVETRPTKP